jgi:hypothetical protein
VSALSYIHCHCSMSHREVREEVVGGQRDRGGLQKLDRLTQDEARMTVAQTLGVVHGLVGNMKVVMEGA